MLGHCSAQTVADAARGVYQMPPARCLLLPAREGHGVRIVTHSDGQDIFAIPQKLCNIQRKGCIPACMRPGKKAVDVHPCPLVGGSEVQQHPPAVLLSERQRPPVPEHLTGFRARLTPDSGASGENGTRMFPSHALGQASEAVMA